MTREKKIKYIGLVGLILYVVFHLLTLSVSPVAWFDEVFFASINHSFITNGQLYLEADPYRFEGSQVVLYGPVYFVLSGVITKIFGFGIFQFRLLGLIFSFLTLGIFYKIIFRATSNSKYAILGVVLLMFDKFFITASHNGRMETVALFFVLYSYYQLLGEIDNWKKHFFSGLLAVIAVLTTPRIGFMIIPIVGYYVWLMFIRKDYFYKVVISGVIWSIPFVLLYGGWLFLAFDSVDEFIELYTSLSSFVGGSIFQITKLQYPMIGILILIIAYSIKNRKIIENYNLFFLFGIILFYPIVNDFGPYTVLIIPSMYFIIINLYKNLVNHKVVFKYSLFALLFFNISFYIFKTSVIIYQYEDRKLDEVNLFIKKIIPEGSTVIGDYRFYYSVIKSSSEYLYNEADFSDDKYELLYRTKNDYDYLIVSKDRIRNNPKLLETYSSKSKLELVGTYEKEVKKLPFIGNIHSNYFCDIYKRVKE